MHHSLLVLSSYYQLNVKSAVLSLDVAAALVADEDETPAVVPANKRTTKFEKRMTNEEMEEEQRSVFPFSLNPSTETTASHSNTQQ